MSRTIRQIVCLLTALCLAAVTVLPTLAALTPCEGCKEGTFAGLEACVTEDGALHLCDKNFPDANFRAFVADRFDKDGNGALEEDEAQAVVSLDCSARSVADLTGVGFFSELTSLNCSDNLLRLLVLSANKKLTTLDCSHNAIPILRLTENTALTSLKAEALALEAPYKKEGNSVDIASLLVPYDSDYIVEGKAQDVNGNQLTVSEASGNFVFSGSDPLYVEYKATTGLSGTGLTTITVRVYPYEDTETEGGVVRTVAGRVLLSGKNFPDDTFRRYVRALAAEDGYTLTEEALAAKEIKCPDMGITDLKGIELFTKLETLDCSGNRLAALDLSANTALQASSVKTDGQKPKGIVCIKAEDSYTVDLAAAVGSGNADNIVSVKAKTAGGADAGAAYDEEKGTVTFSREPASLTYQYRIPAAVKNLPDMDVTAQLTVSELICSEGTFNGSAAYLVGGKLHLCDRNFPDAAFLAAVTEFDTDGDGALSQEEVAAVTEITLAGGSVASLQGVGFFTALSRLSVANNQLTSLDLSENKELTALNCAGNRLATLDLSANEKLESDNVSVSKQTGKQLLMVAADDKYRVDLTDAVGESGRAGVTSVADQNGEAEYDPETGVALFAAMPVSPVTYTYDTGLKNAEADMSVECKVTDASSHDHKNMTLVPMATPTCLTHGHNAYYLCSCGKMFSDEEALNEIQKGTLSTTPALGHLPSAAFSTSKLFHWFVCSRDGCGMMIEGTRAFHRDADKDGKCDGCGYDMTTAEVLGDVDGDNSLAPADARKALRISIKLEEGVTTGSKAYVAADADLDGVVTSADARLILRATVSLESLPDHVNAA